jgi:hypothetical protein
MARHLHYPSAARSAVSLADSRDLRAAVASLLGATPLDEDALREAVWTYVGTERDAGVSPGLVIMSLTEAVGRATITPEALREPLTRNVILWSVEAYFGHLGGDVFRVTADGAVEAPPLSASL